MAGAVAGERTLKPCDLVMKGGITSGVVYPSAMKRLSQDYVFRRIGGASAGAIAAVIGAACEFHRRAHPGADAFAALDTVNAELTRAHFIERLFQPTPGARPAFEAALALQAGRVGPALRALVRRSPGAFVLAAAAVLLWLAFVAVTVVGLAAGGVSTIETIALVLVGVVSAIVLAVLLAGALAWALTRMVGTLNAALVDNGFGMCRGRELTEWLHSRIQFCAGLPANEPLTFGDLKGSPPLDEIALQLITTDLSASRPVDLPLPDPGQEQGRTVYYFQESELAPLFPRDVIEAMTKRAERRQLVKGGAEYYRMPGLDLPIVVAARLSLSFPILLSTVPLWAQDDPQSAPVRHTMSDGGITSNFPIHFFDALLPRWPTFGLDLQPYPDPAEVRSARDDIVFGPGRRPPAFTAVSSVFSFARQILSAALDWRDTMQAELPGFRDRICQIHLSKREGGLNLDMPPDVVAALVARGREAGETVATKFDWDCHRYMRYLTFMQVMQDGLPPASDAFDAFAGAAMPPACPDYVFGQPPAWNQTEPLTAAFFASVAWGTGTDPDFSRDAPTPKGWIRVTPGV